LITSFRRKDTRKGKEYVINPFTVNDAVQLLQKWSGSERVDDKTATKICEFVGSMAYAIRLAGSQMVYRGLTAAEFLKNLEASPLETLDVEARKNESATELLRQNVSYVSEEAQGALGIAGLLTTASFDKNVIAAALQKAADEAAWQLGELVNYSVLNRVGGLYKFSHPLAHSYAQEHYSPSADKVRRVAAYYAGFVLEHIQHPKQLQNDSSNILRAMSWCRRWQYEESTTITKLFQQLIRDVEERAALQITYSIGELAHRSGDMKWAEELYSEVKGLAQKKGYRLELAKARRQLALLAWLEGDKQRAIANLKEANEKGKAAGAWDIVGTSCNFLSELLIEQGATSFILAEQYLLEGLQAAKHCKDEFTVARIVGNLAYLYRKQDNFDKAYALYHEERDFLSGMPLADLIFGIVPGLIEAGNFDEAWDEIREARSICEQENNKGGIAFSIRLQGNLYWKQDELELAEECFQKEERLRLLAVEENDEEIRELSGAMSEQHWFYIKTNQLDKAEQCRIRHQGYFSEHDWVLPHMLVREAEKLIDQRKYQDASQRCHKAMELLQEQGYQKQGNLGLGAWIKRTQGNIEAEQGRLEAAVQLYEEGLELRSRDSEWKYTAEDLNLMAKFYHHKMNDEEQARRYQELARQEYQLVGAKKATVWKRIFHILEKILRQQFIYFKVW
jgi:tetratricopeptide (TPR) repeat protein